MIRAILQDGRIPPLDPLPPEWTEGQELVIEPPPFASAQARIADWAREMDATAAEIPADEHERFSQALDAIERESKEATRRDWGLP